MFVHTGTEETFGQTIQEAMASGLPVVAPASGGPLDIVTHARTGFLYSAESDSEMAENLDVLIRDTELRERMGEAGRIQVSNRTWAHTVNKLLEYYDEAFAIKRHAGTSSASAQQSRA